VQAALVEEVAVQRLDEVVWRELLSIREGE
jgi:hypothetical protein